MKLFGPDTFSRGSRFHRNTFMLLGGLNDEIMLVTRLLKALSECQFQCVTISEEFPSPKSYILPHK